MSKGKGRDNKKNGIGHEKRKTVGSNGTTLFLNSSPIIKGYPDFLTKKCSMTMHIWIFKITSRLIPLSTLLWNTMWSSPGKSKTKIVLPKVISNRRGILNILTLTVSIYVFVIYGECTKVVMEFRDTLAVTPKMKTISFQPF